MKSNLVTKLGLGVAAVVIVSAVILYTAPYVAPGFTARYIPVLSVVMRVDYFDRRMDGEDQDALRRSLMELIDEDDLGFLKASIRAGGVRRFNGIRGLGFCPDPEAGELLREFVDHTDRWVRSGAMNSLWERGDWSGMLLYANDPEAEIRAQVLRNMRKMPVGPEYSVICRRMWADTDIAVRAEAGDRWIEGRIPGWKVVVLEGLFSDALEYRIASMVAGSWDAQMEDYLTSTSSSDGQTLMKRFETIRDEYGILAP